MSEKMSEQSRKDASEGKKFDNKTSGKHNKHLDLDTGVSSVKQMNTHATMLLYVCIMTVLLCCCLGRCLIVPLSQASNYEMNSRRHFSKLDKNALLQQEVIQ